MQICRSLVVFMFIRHVHFLFCVVFTPVLDLFLAKRETRRHQSYSQTVRQANTNDFILVSLKCLVLISVKFIVNMSIFFSYLIQFVFVEFC